MDDLIIIGAGWSGLSAAIFAFQRGLKFRLIAQGVGSVVVTPGWISVWDDSPSDDLRSAIRTLSEAVPDHPYALAGIDALENGLRDFGTFITELGLPFRNAWPNLLKVPTALGRMARPVASLLHTPDVQQIEEASRSILFVGFRGWRDYYPRLSGARSISVDFPAVDRPWDATPTDLARALDDDGNLRQLTEQIKPHLNGATAVGLPAVLSLERHDTQNRVSSALGLPVFEIPTLPPCVPGTRLYNTLRRKFYDEGIRMHVGHPVVRAARDSVGRIVGVEVESAGKPTLFRAKSILFAGGGLYGGGMFSDDRGAVWEQVFGLPVDHVPDRTAWFSPESLAPRGHPVHHFGVRVDQSMRPLDPNGAVIHDNLYLAGKMIRQPDDPRAPAPLYASEGVAIASAYKAVQHIAGV